MLILLALPVVVAVAAIYRYVQDCAPSNVLVRRIRNQRPRWRTALALTAVAGVLLIAMHAVAAAVAGGAPGSLNLVVLILAWDTIKLAAAAFATLLRATLDLCAAGSATSRRTRSRYSLAGAAGREASVARTAQRT